MAAKRISQREARRLQKEVVRLREVLIQQRRGWAREFPDGTHIATINNENFNAGMAWTARRLGHAVVAVPDYKNSSIALYAMPLPSEAK